MIYDLKKIVICTPQNIVKIKYRIYYLVPNTNYTNCSCYDHATQQNHTYRGMPCLVYLHQIPDNYIKFYSILMSPFLSFKL